MLINRYNKFDDKEVIKMAGNNNQRYSDNHARGGSGVRSRNASYNSRGVRSGSQRSGRSSSGGGSGRNRVMTNAEKEAIRDAHKTAVKLYMGEAESLTFSGKAIATWKSGTRGRTFLLKNKNIEELLQNQEENVSE